MANLDLTPFKDVLEKYQEDDSYNLLGKLNLGDWLGSRSGVLIAEIEHLQEQNSTLKTDIAFLLAVVRSGEPLGDEETQRIREHMNQ